MYLESRRYLALVLKIPIQLVKAKCDPACTRDLGYFGEHILLQECILLLTAKEKKSMYFSVFLYNLKK